MGSHPFFIIFPEFTMQSAASEHFSHHEQCQNIIFPFTKTLIKNFYYFNQNLIKNIRCLDILYYQHVCIKIKGYRGTLIHTHTKSCMNYPFLINTFRNLRLSAKTLISIKRFLARGTDIGYNMCGQF